MRQFALHTVLGLLVVTVLVPGGALSRAAMTTGPTEPDSLRHLLQAYSGSGFSYPLRVLITDSASFRRLWEWEVRGDSRAIPIPAIDFTKDVVIAVALGRQSGNGSSIRIESIRVHGEGTEIQVFVSHPGPRCVEGAVFTSPVDIVAVPREQGFAARDAVVLFHDRVVYVNC